MLVFSGGGEARMRWTEVSASRPHSCHLLGHFLEYRIYSQGRRNKARFRRHCPPQTRLLPTQESAAVQAPIRLCLRWSSNATVCVCGR